MIGGNVKAVIENRVTTKNSIGERETSWEPVSTITGWLDLQSGNSNYSNYFAKVEEATHVFLADYVKIDIKSGNSRMVINGANYDIMYIDDPMGMHRQLEFYLQQTGGK